MTPARSPSSIALPSTSPTPTTTGGIAASSSTKTGCTSAASTRGCRGGEQYGYDEDGEYEEPEALVWAIGGIREGELEVRTKSLDEVWWAYPLEAQGQRLVAMTYPGSILSVDASNLDAISLKKHDDLPR